MNDFSKVEKVSELKGLPDEYRLAVEKIVISHSVNELYGAQVFDELVKNGYLNID